MNNYKTSGLFSTPPVVKNIIYINILVFILTYVVFSANEAVITNLFALHYFKSPYFHWWQFISHMFMHAGFDNIYHIIFNMFGLWMFGRVLEGVWGGRRFLIYYMVTGIGAALFYTLVNYFSYSGMEAAISAFANTPTPDLCARLMHKYFEFDFNNNVGFLNEWATDIHNYDYINQANLILHQDYLRVISEPTVGASGAVFGVLLGLAMLFPNTPLFIFFIPIPIKAKWVVLGYGLIELYSGLAQTDSNIAHFAHLGGMLFGFILIKYWGTKRDTFY